MLAYLRKSFLPSSRPSQKRSARPLLENLEDRLLLYSTYGGTWVYGSRITYSFMPDGTNVGGISSVLFQTLDAKFSQATWELQFKKAAAVWQAVANINLSQVHDNGSPEATNGDQQDDPRFGDIRIGMVNLGSGVLGETFLPPPFNGGTGAGDMFLNSTASWQINSSYDLETVAIHEFGHAMGLGESQITTACMYAAYNGIKQSLTTDDINGIQSVWSAPQPDQFNSNGQNNGSYTTSANITSQYRQQRPDRDSQPADHHPHPGRMVLRHGAGVDDGHDGGDRAVKQPQHTEPQPCALHARRVVLSNRDRLGQLCGLRCNGELFAPGCAGRADLSHPRQRQRGR